MDDALDVVGHEGKLYSLRNRRQTAFSMLQAARRDELIRIPCRLFDLERGEIDSQGSPVDRSFWRAFSGRTSDGQRVELKWMPHRVNVPMHHGAPLFGVGAPLLSVNAASTRHQQQVRALHQRQPQMDVETLLRLKQRPSHSARSEFSHTASLRSAGARSSWELETCHGRYEDFSDR